MRRSRRASAVQPPIVPVVGKLIDAHPGTISLGQGMVSYGPPPQALERVAAFGADPEHHTYQPVPGMPELIAALAAKLRRVNGIEVGAGRRVIVSAGSNMAFFQLVLAVTDPDDEVVLLSPYYFNHEMAVRLADCRPVMVPTDAAFQPVVESIRRALSERTRAVVTVSPNNPSGAVYPRRTLAEINDLCRGHGVYHLSDEAYESFVYGAEHVSPGAFPGAAEHTISLYSLSKAYGFASWRVGYAVIPAHLEDALLKIQDTNLICAPAVSQHAALGALEAGPEYFERHFADLRATREVVLEELTELGSFCRRPLVADGAFYVLMELDSRLPDVDLNARLIRDFGVAALPGRAFGLEDRCALRVSYGALERDTVATGIGRLVRGLDSILGGQPSGGF